MEEMEGGARVGERERRMRRGEGNLGAGTVWQGWCGGQQGEGRKCMDSEVLRGTNGGAAAKGQWRTPMDAGAAAGGVVSGEGEGGASARPSGRYWGLDNTALRGVINRIGGGHKRSSPAPSTVFPFPARHLVRLKETTNRSVYGLGSENSTSPAWEHAAIWVSVWRPLYHPLGDTQ